MEQKNRLIIAIIITCLIVVAIFASFGRSIFLVQIPPVELPSPQDSGLSAPENGSSDNSEYWQVEVTPETVQSILATLSRPSSYYRELTVETIWDGGSSSVAVQVWQDSGWNHTRQTFDSGLVRHDLSSQDTQYFWYEGDNVWETVPASWNTADLSQRIPTYETVLALQKEEIVETGYESKDGVACVYVVAQPEGSAQYTRYWVRTDNGLLHAAQQERQGQVVYQMIAAPLIQTPCPATASFVLPDGTVLHTP